MVFGMSWSENIKKNACRYLLQRYLGNYLEEKLSLDQLDVDLFNGTGTVLDVSLDCEAVNELGDTLNWPLEIVDGHVDSITVTIPWSTILKDDSTVEVRGLSLAVQPKVRSEPVSSMLESMVSSMSSSMQLAEECIREQAPTEVPPVEGVEMFAQTIDNITSKIKVRFINTKIRIEHVPKNGERGIALELHIDNADYFDEAGSEPRPEVTDPEKNKSYVVSTYMHKKIKLYGVTLYTDEFPSKLRTMARSLIMEKSTSSQDNQEASALDTSSINYQSAQDVFFETRSVVSTIESDPIKELDEKPPTVFTRESTPEERIATQPDPILFAKLTGHQELSLKVRTTEQVDGPKVEMRMLIGSFIFFLTPRQLHTLSELVDALNQPHLEDTSNIPLRPSGGNVQCKPMRQADFQLIEQQLLSNLEKQARTAATAGPSGWSGPSFEDSDTENEQFLPMTSVGHQMQESFTSSVSSMSASMTSSVNLPSQPRVKRNKRVPHIEGDPTAEGSHISFRIASLSCILLHKDILTTTPLGPEHVNPASAVRLHETSKDFFDRLSPFTISEGSRKEFGAANDALDVATRINHLRLITSEISLDGSEKTTTLGSQTVCEASIKHLLVRECLYSPTSIPPDSFDLIRFDYADDHDSKSSSASTSSRANVKVNFKQTSKFERISGEKKLVYPITDISVKCMPFHLDVELSVLDRMSATFFGAGAAPAPAHPPPQNHLNFSVQCPDLKAVLRFPIADLRATVSREARRVRADYLTFEFHNATFSCHQIASSRPLPTVLTLKATTFDLYYHENDSIPPTQIARSTMSDYMEGDVLKGTSTYPLPSISLTFQPRKSFHGPTLIDDPPMEPATSNPMTTSMYMMKNLQSSVPSPFSGKKTAHQCFTQHEGSPEGHDEEQILPGTEEEMSKFATNSITHSAIHLDFNLPVLSLQLESKQLYEILYNRINSDLLLWEPLIVDPFEINPMMCGTIYPAFGEFKSTGYDSDSNSSTSDDENLYYSTYDHKSKKGHGIKPPAEKKDQHNFCFTLKVGKGLLTIYAPVRDSNKRVVPGQMGELVLEAHKLSMCQVSGLDGIPKTAQLCLRAGTTTLYHDPILTIPAEKPAFRVYGAMLPAHLKRTIYPSAKGILEKETVTRDIFSMALKVEPDSETSNLKTICIALGIEQATLRHRGDKGIAWLTQLMDVIDVLDFPVPGYTPSTVLSQLHVHVWDCAVDYRPLYLPIRTVITLGNFAVSSNLIAATNTSCLRFLAQECTLYLMQVHGCKPNVPPPQNDDKQPNLEKDYVCVVHVGLFELSLRMEDKATCTNEQPQVDLSASNNNVTLYTCWDSAAALSRLLAYIAMDGDSQPPYDPSSRHTSICSDQPIEQLVGLEDRPVEEIRELSPSQIQKVNDLMEEAMKESPNNTLDEDEINATSEKEGVEVFFFPDENYVKPKSDVTNPNEDKPLEMFEDHIAVEPAEEVKPHAQVSKDLGDPTASSSRSSLRRKPSVSKKTPPKPGESNNTDDEFCIIESASARDNDLKEPVVTRPARIKRSINTQMTDNYLPIPTSRTDILKAPKSFPPPVLRYALCEMSINWNMYGGLDFRPAVEAMPKKTVTIDDHTPGSPSASNRRSKDYEPYEPSRVAASYRHGVSYSAGTERVQPVRTPAPQVDKRAKGGPMRDQAVCVRLVLSKLKFIHETYSPGGTHASRQTLAISRVEVLDRLACSRINKLLTHFKTDDMPDKKTHMLVVKAVHMRPQASVNAQECCLKISLMPLWFNFDQDTLAFLVSFFSKLGSDEGGDEDSKSARGMSPESGSRQTTPTHRPPVMSVGDHAPLDASTHSDSKDEPLMEQYQAERLVSDNLIQLEEDFQRLGLSQEKPTAKLVNCGSEPVDSSPIYFRRVVFTPAVPIRLDYVGKRVDLSAGPVAGLLLGLASLNCSELTLVRLDYRLGLLGLEKLIQWACNEWVNHIRRHQLHGLLGGIGPMHSLIQFLTGICDLIWLPVEQWRRDGRLMHGLRRGAASFTARTAVAALDITTRILHFIQATAETAFDMLTPGPTLALQDAYTRRERRRRRRHDPARHPTDIREGVASAYNTVREGFAETAATMALAARCSSGVGVLRHLPGAAVTPLALAAAGAADVLGGVRAHLAPRHSQDARDKWRQQDQL